MSWWDWLAILVLCAILDHWITEFLSTWERVTRIKRGRMGCDP